MNADATLRPAVVRTARVRRFTRFVAVAIAIAAFIDPAVTTSRSGKPVVAVVPVDTHADSALAARVRESLNDRFVVLSSPFARADATVLAGTALPATLDDIASPTFAVTDIAEPSLHIASVRVPASASLHAPVHVEIVADHRASAGTPVSLALQHNGVIVDRVMDSVSVERGRVHASLTFVPTAAGTASLRVLASSGAGADTARADVIVNIQDVALPVLVFDPRPSYQSTFVRRALERDARLRVTSRTVTSRSISTTAGEAPARLEDAAELSRFDAIVVGAPDALTDRDVAGLERFLRERGGSVVLLLDTRARGAFERLLGVRDWRYRDVDRGTRIVPQRGDTATLRAAQQYAPSSLPDGATVIARAHRTAADTGAVAEGDPVLWSTSVGVGRVVVSGALDAWRYREREVSSFDRLWQQLVVDAAAVAIAPVTVELGHAVLAPREQTSVLVSVRSALLRRIPGDGASARVSAHIESGDSTAMVRTPIRLWPTGTAGVLQGILTAPAESGAGRLVITADGHRTETPVRIDPTRRLAAPDASGLLAAWVSAHGGQLISASDLATFPRTLAESVTVGERAERWYPMRSLWWLLPFALALSAEWWLRRRSGLP